MTNPRLNVPIFLKTSKFTNLQEPDDTDPDRAGRDKSGEGQMGEQFGTYRETFPDPYAVPMPDVPKKVSRYVPRRDIQPWSQKKAIRAACFWEIVGFGVNL